MSSNYTAEPSQGLAKPPQLHVAKPNHPTRNSADSVASSKEKVGKGAVSVENENFMGIYNHVSHTLLFSPRITFKLGLSYQPNPTIAFEEGGDKVLFWPCHSLIRDRQLVSPQSISH